jgi:hypothetical protein
MTRKRDPEVPSRQVATAVAWFRDNGPESTLDACAEATGVGLSTAKRARRWLKAHGELRVSFSPSDPGAGVPAETQGDGPPPVPTSKARPLRARNLPEQLEEEGDAGRLAPEIRGKMDAILQRVLEGTVEVLTPEQSLQYASALVSEAPTFQLRVMALRELNKLRATVGEQEELGPGKPTTVGDQVRRHSRIMKASGRERSAEAWKLAFEEEITEVVALQSAVEGA